MFKILFQNALNEKIAAAAAAASTNDEAAKKSVQDNPPPSCTPPSSEDVENSAPPSEKKSNRCKECRKKVGFTGGIIHFFFRLACFFAVSLDLRLVYFDLQVSNAVAEDYFVPYIVIRTCINVHSIIKRQALKKYVKIIRLSKTKKYKNCDDARRAGGRECVEMVENDCFFDFSTTKLVKYLDFVDFFSVIK